MTAKEILKELHKDGWIATNQKGSHLHLEHPTKPGKITVPKHSGDLPIGTLKNIRKTAGLK